MSGYINPDDMDVYLQNLADTGDLLTLCSQQPADFTEATATYMLAYSAALTSGDFTIADGDTSGRKLTLDALSGAGALIVDAGGTATYWALTASGDSNFLVASNSCTELLLYIGNTVATTATKITEIRDPA